MGTWYDGYDVYEDNEGVFLSDTFTGVGPPRESAWHNTDLGPLLQTEPQNPEFIGGPSWLPLAAYGTGLALGNQYTQGGIADMLTPNVNSVAMEGPMRFAGRGIPDKGYHKDYPGLAGPDYPIEDGPDVMIPMPMPRFPTLPGRAPISIWETSPDGGPRRGSRKPPYRIPMAPDKGPDLRTKWEVWRDSFRDDWRAK